jgi:hypothetical protein
LFFFRRPFYGQAFIVWERDSVDGKDAQQLLGVLLPQQEKHGGGSIGFVRQIFSCIQNVGVLEDREMSAPGSAWDWGSQLVDSGAEAFWNPSFFEQES